MMAQRVDAFSTSGIIDGPRYELDIDDARYPASLRTISRPPKRLYVLGDLESLEEGLAVVGARRATPMELVALNDLLAWLPAGV